MEEEYKKWLTQFRKGYVELCTLIALDKNKKLNGTSLLSVLIRSDITITEGTLYPLLNRMEQNGFLVSTWQIPKNSGHPKKEYEMTQKANILFPKLLESFRKHNDSINDLLGKD